MILDSSVKLMAKGWMIGFWFQTEAGLFSLPTCSGSTQPLSQWVPGVMRYMHECTELYIHDSYLPSCWYAYAQEQLLSLSTKKKRCKYRVDRNNEHGQI
jgi:hypothetical protein